jgi:hypothetical protein
MMTDVIEVAERAKTKMANAATEIMRDVCNLDGYVREDNPNRLVLTTDQLDLILRRHLHGEDV